MSIRAPAALRLARELLVSYPHTETIIQLTASLIMNAVRIDEFDQEHERREADEKEMI